MDQINKSKNNDFDTIKLIRSDINEYINRAEECKINLYKNEILILSKCIFLLILKHGYTRCEKELNISQDILKKILNFQKEKSS